MGGLLAHLEDGVHLPHQVAAAAGSLEEIVPTFLEALPSVMDEDEGRGLGRRRELSYYLLALSGVVLIQLMGLFQGVYNYHVRLGLC